MKLKHITETTNLTVSTIANLDYYKNYHEQWKTLSWDDFYTVFSELTAPQRLGLVPYVKPMFKITSGLVTNDPGTGNTQQHSNLVVAVWNYMLKHSISLAEADQVNGYTTHLTNLAKALGVTTDDISVYYGNMTDFKNYFLDSDFLSEAQVVTGYDSNREFFEEGTFRMSFFTAGWDWYFPFYTLDEDGNTYYLPLLNAETVAYPAERIQQFVDMPTWEHVWKFLKLTHHLIELGGITILVDRNISLTLTGMNSYVDILEAIEPIEVLDKDIATEREEYIFLLENITDNMLRSAKDARRRLRAKHDELMSQKINHLEKTITDFGKQEVKEVNNEWTW